jgi:oligosaccharide repeat unit polymerase
MSLSLTVFLLAVWSVVMRRYGRSMLFPPASLSLVWTVTLFTIWLCGDHYYPLTYKANAIVLTGVLCFSLGGLLAAITPMVRTAKVTDVDSFRRMQIDRWLNIALALCVGNIPLFIHHVRSVSDTIAPRTSLWRQMRIAASKANISGQTSLSLESLILPFITVIAMIAVHEYAVTGRRGMRAFLLVVLAGGYQLVNGARSEVLLLLISSIVLLWLGREGPPLRMLGAMCLMFLMVFSAGQISMSKYGADPTASVGSNVSAVAEGFGTYWLGGIIAFDQNRQNPELPYGWDLGKFAKRIANRFGASYSERDRNLAYTKISPSQITNVYTVFRPYYLDHGGMWGVIWLMGSMGFLSVYVYRCAMHGYCWAVFVLGAFVYATVMTIFSEEYFAQIMFWIKAGCLSTLVYFAPSLSTSSLQRYSRRFAAQQVEPCA